MPLDINGLIDVHARSLAVSNQRLELLADNLANADTPQYKAKDLDFRTAMQELAGGTGGDLALAASRGGQSLGTAGAGTPKATAQYRTPDQPSLDGNTVDPQRENAAFAETSVRYQTSLTFLQARIQGLRTAITGGR